ncbi:LysM peptidoglycan-binding domain-containing protein [Actinocatenispora sera]|uniref:LysM peptidoglycan-binding domain-containing protein n=1 Tax=Actinocatenispora sera TaxID=390989 RepID=UPI0006915640|nr:LysM peptidoglycan-binding domain-containing protein [Actinocatenispora sera]
MRLTRRGRLVRTVAVLVLAAGLGAAAASSGDAEPPVRRVEVHRGDTLWSIADRYSASRDPVTTIERIRHLNHLSGYTIYPGQELSVPAGDR